MVKINWDVALAQQNKVVGLGIIARDDARCFLSACGFTKRMTVMPVVAEALAALHAMIFCKENGFTKTIFEGDALQMP